MKLWVYQPRGRPVEIHTRRETILEDMADDLEQCKEDEGTEWAVEYEVGRDRIYIDDAGWAELVEVIE